MRCLLPIALLAACSDPNPLGGQEGEPLAPESPPPAAPVNDADAGFECEPVAHCAGEGWCAEYGPESLPDLEAACEGNWADGPCDATGASATCVDPAADACSAVYVWEPVDASEFCDANGLTPR